MVYTDLLFADDKKLEERALAMGSKKLIVVGKDCFVLGKADGSELRKQRQKFELIAVNPMSLQDCKFAVSSKQVDLLFNPFQSKKTLFDIALAKLAKQNNVFIALNFSELLNKSFSETTYLMEKIKALILLCNKVKFSLLIFSGAKTVEELRSVQDLQAFLEFLGLKPELARMAVKENPLKLFERRKLEGVKVVRK
ncbi:MAG: RNase P subunit p30 family protein [archaeon]